MKFKFPAKTKIAHVEEFIKRKVQIKPTESVFLFEKKKKKLLNSGITVADLLAMQASSKIEGQGEADCEIIMRLT